MKKLICFVLMPSLVLWSCSPKGFSTGSSSSADGSDSAADVGSGGGSGGGVGGQTGDAGSGGTAGSTDTTGFARLKAQVEKYRARYGLNDAFTKLVDNQGNLYPPLYGVRNFRAVLHGVYYRGGANNAYNKVDGVRNNMNPLPPSGLKDLCEQGFKEAIYLYSTNYASSPKSASCDTVTHDANTMNYVQVSPLTYKNDEVFLQKVFQVIKGEKEGPIYGHCWNGWHASGYVGAIVLKQFCGYSDAQALDYWKRNAMEGGIASHQDVMDKVVSFKPIAKYNITKEEAALVCP